MVYGKGFASVSRSRHARAAFLPSYLCPDNFEDYWRVASKITPTASPFPFPIGPNSPHHQHSTSTLSSRTAVPGDSSLGGKDSSATDSAYTVRSIPARIFLPDHGPVLQELVAPLVAETGTPTTLRQFLSLHLPLLFPPLRGAPSLAYALVQGVLCPDDAEMAWLGACMAGADGWVNICVGLTTGSSSNGLTSAR